MAGEQNIMIDEEEIDEQQMVAIPLPKDYKLVDNVIYIPACLAQTMAINLLIQKDLQENL